MDYWHRNMRVVLIGGLIGITGALLVSIVMIAHRIHHLLVMPALLLDILLLIIIRRRWTIPILGGRTPYCLETNQPADRATYLLRAALGMIIGIPLGFALAMRVTRNDAAFIIVWGATTLSIVGVVTICGERVFMR